MIVWYCVYCGFSLFSSLTKWPFLEVDIGSGRNLLPFMGAVYMDQYRIQEN